MNELPFMSLKYTSIFTIIGSLYLSGHSQSVKRVQQQQQCWVGYFSQVRFSDKWGVWSDFQLRTKEYFFTDFSVSIIRYGMIYYINEQTKLVAGHAIIHYYPAEGHEYVTQPEQRLWQLFQWKNNYNGFELTQAFRLEERFRRKILNDSILADGHNFNYRLRYCILAQVPLNRDLVKAKKVSLVFNSEMMLNFGKEIVYNYFDQLRSFCGINYQFHSHWIFQTGYMNVFQQLPAGNRYKSLHVARLFLYYSLDTRKNKK